MPMAMNQVYMTSNPDYCNSPMSFATVPDLVSSYDDITTDPSPSPPMMFAGLDTQFQPYPASPAFHDFMHQQSSIPHPAVINSIEFTDLTQINSEDSPRRRRRSTTAQDKEAATNMRIRRRAQNRASQRAFRERKEKHVLHLERELEQLESKHRDLEKSYSEVEGSHAKLQQECEELREALSRLRGSSVSGHSSREGSVSTNSGSSTQHSRLKMEDGDLSQQPDIFDPFGTEDFFA